MNRASPYFLRKLSALRFGHNRRIYHRGTAPDFAMLGTLIRLLSVATPFGHCCPFGQPVSASLRLYAISVRRLTILNSIFLSTIPRGTAVDFV